MSRPRRPLTVRERIVAAVVALTALALLVAGGTAWIAQRHRVDDDIDSSLSRTVTEMRTLADTGVDSRSGEPFSDANSLLYTMMEHTVPDTHEGMIALVDGELRYLTPDIGVPLAEDEQFLAEVADTGERDHTLVRSLRTEEREYRYAAVPVAVGDTTGAFVLAYDRGAQQASVDETFRTYALIAAAAVVLLAIAAWLLAGRLLRPLRDLRTTAARISDTDLTTRIPVAGNDDISVLATTFNNMLDRLAEAFASQRRLLDDAGHELRTPLTIIRGHLELMDPADAADAAETQELALHELDRMHRLADDLVLLAKSEAPDFIQPRLSDVGMLLDNVLDLVRGLASRRWQLAQRLEVRAELDTQRMTQALLQLAANAVSASEEGSRIELGSTLEPGGLQLWVADEGVGISTEDIPGVFERFRQIDPAEQSSAEGSGLGLSIVAAIAKGHGGHVTVASEPGVGSCFVIHLPAGNVEVLTDDVVEHVEEQGIAHASEQIGHEPANVTHDGTATRPPGGDGGRPPGDDTGPSGDNRERPGGTEGR